MWMWPVLLGAGLLFLAMSGEQGESYPPAPSGPFPDFESFRAAVFSTTHPQQLKDLTSSLGGPSDVAHPWIEQLLEEEAYADHIFRLVEQHPEFVSTSAVPPEEFFPSATAHRVPAHEQIRDSLAHLFAWDVVTASKMSGTSLTQPGYTIKMMRRPPEPTRPKPHRRVRFDSPGRKRVGGPDAWDIVVSRPDGSVMKRGTVDFTSVQSVMSFFE
jgi:hypothetical protein